MFGVNQTKFPCARKLKSAFQFENEVLQSQTPTSNIYTQFSHNRNYILLPTE